MLPLHLGQLHPLEQLLVMLLAFGPFLIAGGLAVVLRRRDAAAEQEGQAGRSTPAERPASRG